MAIRKPRFNGNGAGVLVPDFPASVRSKLRKVLAPHFDPDQMGSMRAFLAGAGQDDWRTGDGSDDLIGWLLHDAYELKVEIASRKSLSLTKPQLVAEFESLAQSLRLASEQLRSASRDLDRILMLDVATRCGVEDGLVALLAQTRSRRAAVMSAVPLQRTAVFEHGVKMRLVASVAGRLRAEGIPVAGRDTPLFDVLDCIGSALDLRLSEKTWRNAVSRLKVRPIGRQTMAGPRSAAV